MDSKSSLNYPPNSNNYKRKEKKHVESVVQAAVSTRKKPLGKKFAETFLGDDLETVKGYIFFDVIVPTIKDTISNVISSGVDMLLFGESRHGHNTRRDGSRSYVSYSNYYKPDSKAARYDTGNNGRHDFRDIVYQTRGEAEEVLSNLVDLVCDFEVASVADLYDLSGISSSINHTDNKWGWRDLSGASISRVRGGGYSINLPRCEHID